MLLRSDITRNHISTNIPKNIANVTLITCIIFLSINILIRNIIIFVIIIQVPTDKLINLEELLLKASIEPDPKFDNKINVTASVITSVPKANLKSLVKFIEVINCVMQMLNKFFSIYIH